ncbi:MAG: response regulator transcription factor [Actinomycetota bacterium]
MASQLVLVVDDEESVCDIIVDALHLAEYRTLRAGDGATALSLMREQQPDLVILDVNMPRMTGFEVLEKMRQAGIMIPAILLTARHSREDTVTGFRLGADDYVKKPFGLEELLLRVSAVLRRTSGAEEDVVMRCGNVVMNLDVHQVTVADEVVELSPTEFRLLRYLMENKNRVLSKQQILDAVWGIDFDSNTTVVETFVSYLRKKLANEGEQLLITVRGVGFKIVDPKKNA